MGRSYAKKSGFRIPVPAMLAPLLQLLKSPKITNLLKGAPHYAAAASKMRLGYSGSSTSSKDGRKQIITAAGGSISVFNMGFRKLHPSFQKTATDILLVNGSFRNTVAVGKQAIQDLAVPFNITDTTAIRGLVATNATALVAYKEAYTQIQITNQDNGNVLITLYDVICKRSGSLGPSQSWITGTASAGSTNQQNVVGAEPTSCPRFNNHWIVKKTYQFYLGAGQSHCHVLKYNPNMQIPGEVQDITNFVQGLTHGCMMVVNGAPYNDVTTKTQVSSGGCAIDTVVSIQYKFTSIADAVPFLTTTNALPNFTVGENIMNEDTGTAAAEVQA